jgi:predicted alpha/beta hydrolase
MTWRGTQNLINLYANAPRTFERIAPADLKVKRIGHFGFFREQFNQTLWPRAQQIIEGMAGVAKTAA